jgi:hypothetical protein
MGESERDVQRGCFPGAVGSQKSDDLAAFNREIEFA